MKLPLIWATPELEVYGNALGYAHHAKMMKKYSEPFFDYVDDAKVVLHIVSADHFRPVLGKINVLFTMWEFMDLPESYIRSISKADVIIVPCAFCRDLFKRYTDKPVYVCHEGIEPENFPFYDRMQNLPKDGKRFRFLWSGAPNQRKGYQYVLKAVELFQKVPEVELYIKTTSKGINMDVVREKAKNNPDDQDVVEACERMIERDSKLLSDKKAEFGEHKNIIIDMRKLPFDELVALYNSTHCFLMPTLGEGWGLILSEMMATGCPCLTTMQTGIKDFCNSDVAFEIKSELGEIDMGESYGGLKTKAYFPDINDFVGKMIGIMKHYDVALMKGRKASQRIHGRFTWQNAGKRLSNIISEVYDAHEC